MGSLIASLIVGGVAGWLAGIIMKGQGQGVLMNIIVGIIGGVLGGWLFGSSEIVLIGFLMFAGAMLFQLLTLPVEFNASHRALAQLEKMGFESEQDRVGARRVLRAAAMTYVAGAATAMGKLLVILFIAGRGLFGRLLGAGAKLPK